MSVKSFFKHLIKDKENLWYISVQGIFYNIEIELIIEYIKIVYNILIDNFLSWKTDNLVKYGETVS